MSDIIEPVAKDVPSAIMAALKKALKATHVPELASDAWSLNVLREVSLADRLSVNVVLPSFGLRSEKQIAFAIKKALIDEVDDPEKIDLFVYSDVKPAAVQSINT